MVMSIAIPIKAGKNGPKKAGNRRKARQISLDNKGTSQPKPNSKGPSNRRQIDSTAATRLDSRVIKGLEVTTSHRDILAAAEAAEEAEVVEAVAEAVVGSSVK